MAELNQDEFVEQINKIISKNLKVEALPIIRKDGTIGAGARMTVGEIDDDLYTLADQLGLKPGPVVEGKTVTEDADHGDEEEDDTQSQA